jgi:hypothetical protein
VIVNGNEELQKSSAAQRSATDSSKVLGMSCTSAHQAAKHLLGEQQSAATYRWHAWHARRTDTEGSASTEDH